MPLLNFPITQTTTRTYDIYVPPNPLGPLLPAIIVFHGGGQDIRVMEKNWGIQPPNPVPAAVRDYLLVFPETDPTLDDVWLDFQNNTKRFPEHDLLFLDALVNDLIARAFPAGGAFPTVSANPAKLYTAGFSSGAGMVWQIANSNRVATFQGFAAVGAALDPAKPRHYRRSIAPAAPPAIPLMFIMGTSDPHFRSPTTLSEVPMDMTYPAFAVQEMINRNGIPAGPAVTKLWPGSTNETEVIGQLFGGGAAAFAYITVINGGHNWPTPTTVGNPPVATHFNATTTIIEFWRNHAALP